MRLVRGGDFDRAFAEGGRARGAVLLVVARPNGLDRSRLGLSVGRVIWKSAVKRNRVRRIFREAFRLSYGALPPGCDLVLVPAAPKLEPELATTCAELVRLAHQARERFGKPRPPRAPRPRDTKPKERGSAPERRDAETAAPPSERPPRGSASGAP